MNIFAVLPFAALFVLSGCSESPPSPATDSHAVTIMTFNVQNLFDNHDDAGKDDKAYLPIGDKQSDAHIAACNEIEVASWRDECLNLDWSDDAISFKLGVLAAVIRQIEGGPDIIAFQEIENAAILNRLRNEWLAELEYGPAILIEGQDNRGIDVAFLSRLPVVGTPTLHAIEFPDFPEREGDTRGILEASFALPDGSTLTGFAVHFPAPFHPTEMRIAAYEQLARLRANLPGDHYVFAAGDFNTTSADDRETGILAEHARPDWTIAHETGCDECLGTSYYARDDSWSFLDMILYSPPRGENATWGIRAESVRVLNANPAQVSEDGTPERFVAAERRGVSDHWPIGFVLEVL